jgi:hypothetical protein
LPFQTGRKGAKLYDSVDALAEIYGSDSLQAARAEQARSQAALNRVREESLRKERIPIGDVEVVMDDTFQSIAATLKAEASKHRPLTREIVNDLFEKFRAAPRKLKW